MITLYLLATVITLFGAWVFWFVLMDDLDPVAEGQPVVDSWAAETEAWDKAYSARWAVFEAWNAHWESIEKASTVLEDEFGFACRLADPVTGKVINTPW